MGKTISKEIQSSQRSSHACVPLTLFHMAVGQLAPPFYHSQMLKKLFWTENQKKYVFLAKHFKTLILFSFLMKMAYN